MGIIRYAWVDVLDVVLLLAYAKSGPFLMYDSIRSIDANPTCVQTILPEPSPPNASAVCIRTHLRSAPSPAR